jgi:hypothetical protein
MKTHLSGSQSTYQENKMSQKCAIEEGGKQQCGTCGGHSAAMSMLGLVMLAVIGGVAAMFFGK